MNGKCYTCAYALFDGYDWMCINYNRYITPEESCDRYINADQCKELCDIMYGDIEVDYE